MILVLNSLTGANVYENVLHCTSHARIQFKEWLVIIHWLITLLSWLCFYWLSVVLLYVCDMIGYLYMNITVLWALACCCGYPHSWK